MGSPLADSADAGVRRIEGQTLYDLAEDTGGHSALFECLNSERKLVVRMNGGSSRASVVALPSLWRNGPFADDQCFSPVLLR